MELGGKRDPPTLSAASPHVPALREPSLGLLPCFPTPSPTPIMGTKGHVPGTDPQF